MRFTWNFVPGTDKLTYKKGDNRSLFCKSGFCPQAYLDQLFHGSYWQVQRFFRRYSGHHENSSTVAFPGKNPASPVSFPDFPGGTVRKIA